MVPLVILAAGVVLTYCEDDELSLTGLGCRVMAHHGVPMEALDEEGLCPIRARFHLAPEMACFGTIHIDDPSWDARHRHAGERSGEQGDVMIASACRYCRGLRAFRIATGKSERCH